MISLDNLPNKVEDDDGRYLILSEGLLIGFVVLDVVMLLDLIYYYVFLNLKL